MRRDEHAEEDRHQETSSGERLPRKQKKLTRDEQKNVKGGIIAVLIGKTDGSKNITDGTSNTVLPPLHKP